MDSVSEARLAECKLLLVASLALQRGEFWELIKNVRATWGITAETRLPPPGESRTLYPEHVQGSDHLYRWESTLEDLKGKAVHPRYFPRTNWRAFMSLCCLYDPPPPRDDPPTPGGLRAFCDYGGTRHESPSWPNPHDLLAEERASYEELAEALLERLRLAGRDPEKELTEALRSIRGSRTNQHSEIRFYDVAELIKEPARQGRPPTIENMATALECVILQERYSWTYERMAAYHGWHDYTRASKYLAYGRKLLDA